MEIAAADLNAESAYRLLVGAVVPRPIAWVTTLSESGRTNAAPFSCFTFVCYAPPMVAISVGRKGDVLKDTARNIAARKEFVVNIGDDSLVEPLHMTSAEYPDDISEVQELGLDLLPSREIQTPRISVAPINLECRLHDVFEFGELRTQLIVGEVRYFHIRDGLCENGKIDTALLRPLGRLGGPKYVTLGEIITMKPVPASFG
ncbi:MAG: hypothetical protein QOK29_917 [Rhodospirillaceae bacterium]|jgi:flavin reductase (DIM6/NTAB) family NADH-FMN oxidoreductase RutF|nr:hypothetical protein [Rhodospirillaceae bacterium]